MVYSRWKRAEAAIMDNRLDEVGVVLDNKATIGHLVEWFLLKENMSHKKIQKLCYYAHVWSLTLFNQDIIPNITFEAWVHGPVNFEIWNMCKRYGWRDIMVAEEFLEISKKEAAEVFNENQKKILNLVWETYGEYDADELEEMTHIESPWKDSRNGLGKFEPSRKVITREQIREYYKDKYE